jgi:hypothetical protein
VRPCRDLESKKPEAARTAKRWEVVRSLEFSGQPTSPACPHWCVIATPVPY